MTSRFLLLALAAGTLALGSSGCNRGGGASGEANLDSLATGDPANLVAYNTGFETGTQLRERDSTFNYDRFREGFDAGARGDSTELAYVLGVQAGLGFHADSVLNFDPELFLAGFQGGLRGDSSRVTPEQVARASSVFQDSVQMRQLQSQARSNPEAQVQLGQIRANAAASRRFLAGVERRPGVEKTASGLLYTVTTPGRGASPTDADQVRIRYVGKLADGTVFDQSPEGEPFQLPVAGVVPGFGEALKMMRPGETRTVWLPANLAYGIQGAPGPNGEGGIPPNSAIQFELTLVEVVPGAPPGMPAGMPPGAFVPEGAGR